MLFHQYLSSLYDYHFIQFGKSDHLRHFGVETLAKFEVPTLILAKSKSSSEKLRGCVLFFFYP